MSNDSLISCRAGMAFLLRLCIGRSEAWAQALRAARSSQDRTTAEAAKAQDDADTAAHLKAQDRVAADTTVQRKVEEHVAAEETARLKKRERDAADAAVRIKAQERATAEETARLAADEWTAAKAAARSPAAVVESIMLQVLHNRPMTSSEVAEILDKEQEQAITWLRQLHEDGRVEFIWLKRSPHFPCYRSKVHANVLASAQDTGSATGAEAVTARPHKRKRSGLCASNSSGEGKGAGRCCHDSA